MDARRRKDWAVRELGITDTWAFVCAAYVHDASYLGGLECGVRAVYLYGSTMNDEAGFCSDIDLIVLVERKRDQARVLLRQLDLALLTSYRTLIGEGHLPATLLDVHFVDEGEEKARRGYGAVLRSLHTGPVSLWWRNLT